jgi:predicted NBD/HSP70 family sugar kinase
MARTLHHPVPELADLRLAEQIQARTGIHAFVDNDVNALALGEWTFGLARGATSLVLLAIGTNIGGGIIYDGRVVRGHRGFAGELGHVPINFDGPPCFCGGRGCLGMYVGGRHMAREAANRVRLHPDSLVRLEADILQRAGRYAYPQAFANTRIYIAAADKRRTLRGGAALVLYELDRQGRPGA